MSAIVSAALLASCSAAPGPVLPPPEAPASATEEPSVTTPASQCSAACEEWDPRELEWRSLSNPTEAQRADDAGVDVIVSRASLPASSSSRYNTGVEICPGFLWLVTHSGDSVFVSLIDDTWAQGPSLIPSGATDNVGARGVESGGPVWGFRGSVGATEWLYLSDAVIDTTAQCVRLEVHRLGVSALLDGNSSTDVIYEPDPCVDYASTERGITPIKTHLGGALAYSEDNDELYVSLGDFHLGASQIGQAVTAGLEATERDYAVLLDDQSALSSVVAIRAPSTRADSRIFAKGLRNSLGMTVGPDGTLWLSDHGPGGGDELNAITENADYGWPLTSEGRPYDRSAWPREADKLLAPWLDFYQADVPGTTPPRYSWTPAIAPSAVVFYAPQTEAIPEWSGDIIIGALRGQALVRLTPTAEGNFTESRLDLEERVRDMILTSRGTLAVLTDSSLLITVGR